MKKIGKVFRCSGSLVGKKILLELEDSQRMLVSLFSIQEDSILNKKFNKKARFEKIKNEILQHDVYHISQITYITSLHGFKK